MQYLLFHTDQIKFLLTAAFEETRRSPGKHVYQTSFGVRALSETEAATDSHAKRIDFGDPRENVALVMKTWVTDPNAQTSYQDASQMVTAIFQRYLGREPTQRPTLDMRQLTHTAEDDGFGYKKANLDQVNELCKQNFGPYTLEVPQYAGIPSAAVQQLLKRHGLDVSARWTEILETHYPANRPEHREQVFLSKNFSEVFLLDCAKLRQEIMHAFMRAASAEAQGDLNQLFRVDGLASVVDQVNRRNERLMVRSSGKEDTVELANAGGNASVANVIPSTEETLQAIAQVVSSYFGEKSLKQRAGADDRSLFDPIAFTPVLIQRMIGERNPATPPKCGVLFTEDCESRSLANRDVRITSGITVIQAAYGHNEGVVNGLIPVDTYYINEQRALFPIVRPKTHRMMPTQRSGELQLTENDPTKASTSSLSLSAIQTLKNFAQALEQFYGRPMDVEFVIEEPNKIYIVQARPLVHRTDVAPASYIADLSQFPASDIVKGSTIGAAGGGLRVAEPKEVVTASTIGKALDEFQTLEHPQTVQAAIVGRFAPATSHWATVFRSAGKPVLYTNRLSTVQSWLENPETRLLVSPQQGLIVRQTSDTVRTGNELMASGACALGWLAYPAAPLLSVCPELYAHGPLPEDFIQQICPALRDPRRWEQFQQDAGRVPTHEVFEALPTKRGDELNMLLAILLFIIKQICENRGELAVDSEQQARLTALQRLAFEYAKSIKENGRFAPNDSQFGCKLLPIHFFKALFYAQADSDEVVGGESLTLILREMREEQSVATALQKQGIVLKNPISLSLLRLSQYIIKPEIAQHYRRIIIDMDQLGRDDRLNAFARWVFQLQKLDTLVTWLNLVFPNEPDITTQFKAFENQKAWFASLAGRKAAVRALNISAFGDKRSFGAQWQVMNQQVLEPVKTELFAETYRNADVLGKLATLGLMKQIVDKFDLAIKELEGAPVGTGPGEYTMEEKLKLFQTMLQEYYALTMQWANTLLIGRSKFNFNRWLEQIRRVVFATDHKIPTTFHFSKDFDVAAFGAYSGASLVNSPRTLEDAFSALHQELLTTLNVLNSELTGNTLTMPPLMERVTSTVPLGLRTGIELDASGMTVSCTKPLRAHGVQYRLHQPRGSQKLTLTMNFSGMNVLNRWDHIAYSLLLLQINGKFDVGDILISKCGMEATFHLDNNDQLETLKELLSVLEVYSTEGSDAVDVKPPDVAQFDNSTKQLPVWKDSSRILRAFATLGTESLLLNPVVRQIVQQAVLAEDPFAISLFQKAWEHFDRNTQQTLINMSIELAKEGHQLEFIARRSLQLMDLPNSRDERGFMQILHAGAQWEVRDFMQILHVVAQKDPQKLPDDCAWEILKKTCQLNVQHRRAGEEVLDILTRTGALEVSVQKYLIPALLSPDNGMRSTAEAVLRLIVANSKRWITEGVKNALQRAAADPTMASDLRTLIFSIPNGP
jgi:hypothetical protein